MIPKAYYMAINDVWPMILIFVIVISFVRLFSLSSNNKKIYIYKEFISLLFAIYLLLLFELVTNTDMQSIGNNFIPFKEITRYSFTSPLFYRNVLGNIVLFLPFGLFLTYFVKKCSLFKVMTITLITSFTIEAVQSNIGRSFDVDDIILNIIGGILGFLIAKFFKKIYNILPKFLKSEFFLNLLAVILFLILILIFLNYTGIWRFF